MYDRRRDGRGPAGTTGSRVGKYGSGEVDEEVFVLTPFLCVTHDTSTILDSSDGSPWCSRPPRDVQVGEGHDSSRDTEPPTFLDKFQGVQSPGRSRHRAPRRSKEVVSDYLVDFVWTRTGPTTPVFPPLLSVH